MVYSWLNQSFLNSEAALFTTAKNISEFLVVITKGLTASLSLDEALPVVRDLAYNLDPASGPSTEGVEQ